MRSTLRYSANAQTHEGRVRSVNEDSLAVRSDIGLWAVADGMGGHEDGQWASRAVIEALDQVVMSGEFDTDLKAVRDAILVANDRIVAEAESRGARMGSTVVCLVADGSRFACLWVGDSRGYILRDDRFEQLSRDHTQVQDMLERGIITAEEADGHPMSHILSRAIGVDHSPVVDAVSGELKSTDLFLLCSDGLSGVVSAEEMKERLATVDPATAARDLLDLTLSRNAPDNVTLITVACEEMTALTLPTAS